MADRLADLLPPLVIVCTPCKRRGSYRVCRLIQRFGPHAGLASVIQALTQSCPHQHRPGERVGNQYTSPGCLAGIELPKSGPPPLRHDTSLSDRRAPHFAVDEWLPGREAIAQELAHVSGLVLARAVYEAAVRLDPHAPITLRRGGHVVARSYEDPPAFLHSGKWEPPKGMG